MIEGKTDPPIFADYTDYQLESDVECLGYSLAGS